MSDQITSFQRLTNIKEKYLLGTKYKQLASNTVDYWMSPSEATFTQEQILNAVLNAPIFNETTFQIYIHIPFCLQSCLFCAFTGSNSKEIS